ncbi:YtxH domain-containing protein [Microterricola viridarii]|uniref:Uncharacterized protein n=1 Tax=Microterricola viridarii TaxID=412690 RepID=A0A1H1M8N9_9MICO|nr:YtxH domain-containing protein [Microterricola viridarii]SDR82399.1 hypothetical protein SAMN04489834_0324 [Microterricola viridarii]
MSSPSDDFSNALSDAVGKASDKAEDAVDAAKDKAGDLADSAKRKADDLADSAKRKADDLADSAKRKADDVYDQVRKTVGGAGGNDVIDDTAGFLRRQMRDRPWVVVGAAALVAFALGVSVAGKGKD